MNNTFLTHLIIAVITLFQLSHAEVILSYEIENAFNKELEELPKIPIKPLNINPVSPVQYFNSESHIQNKSIIETATAEIVTPSKKEAPYFLKWIIGGILLFITLVLIRTFKPRSAT